MQVDESVSIQWVREAGGLPGDQVRRNLGIQATYVLTCPWSVSDWVAVQGSFVFFAMFILSHAVYQ